jgi:multimeric flavodoxin WrbA
MKKKVLVISSSPRNGGNSDLLCDQFILGASEAGNDVQKIFLKDKTIHYCTGCGTCLNGKKPCPQKDDMADILDRMVSSDAIVMATPVYFYTMCGQMKTFIDRICARYAEISNKDFYFIVTAATGNKQAMERTIEGFRGLTDCLDEPSEKGIIYGAGAWNRGDIAKSPVMSEAFELGKQV